jgi:hypothetical protein
MKQSRLNNKYFFTIAIIYIAIIIVVCFKLLGGYYKNAHLSVINVDLLSESYWDISPTGNWIINKLNLNYFDKFLNINININNINDSTSWSLISSCFDTLNNNKSLTCIKFHFARNINYQQFITLYERLISYNLYTNKSNNLIYCFYKGDLFVMHDSIVINLYTLNI